MLKRSLLHHHDALNWFQSSRAFTLSTALRNVSGWPAAKSCGNEEQAHPPGAGSAAPFISVSCKAA